MFKNLSKTEIISLKGKDIRFILAYKKLKENGVTHKNTDFAVNCINAISLAFIENASSEQLQNLSKLLYYFEKLQKKKSDPLHVVAIDYIDYFYQIRRLNIINADYFPANFELAHQRLSQRIREIELQKENENNLVVNSIFKHLRKSYKHFNYKDGEYIVRIIDSKRELIVEGEQQNNCVAGYDNLHIKGEKCIFVIRHKSDVKKSIATIEMDMQTNKIIQCRAYKNKQVTQDVENFKNKWLEHLKRKVG